MTSAFALFEMVAPRIVYSASRNEHPSLWVPICAAVLILLVLVACVVFVLTLGKAVR
jgi:hypothetical protein